MWQVTSGSHPLSFTKLQHKQSTRFTIENMKDTKWKDIASNASKEICARVLWSSSNIYHLTLQKEFLDKYESFVQLVAKVYPNETIPSVVEMRELLASQ